ncbi:MAG TPA: hypothetical protein VJ010_01235 [Actinomycetota bacterium]|nr:hypothetical protein [Actinomycetota bacterium]
MDENLKGRSVSDEMILASLRMAAAIREPVPASVLQAARDAFAWRLIDAELAELVADSACELASAGTRGGGQPRLVTFEVPGGTSLELEAGSHGGGICLVGQVVPARPGTAEVQHRGGSVAVAVDEVGCFAAYGICPGPMRVRLRLVAPGAAGRPELEIVTASLTL